MIKLELSMLVGKEWQHILFGMFSLAGGGHVDELLSFLNASCLDGYAWERARE